LHKPFLIDDLKFDLRIYVFVCGIDPLRVYVYNEGLCRLSTVKYSIAHTYRSCQPDDVENSMCFEILGFDIFLDDNLKPWIIEVNHAPSFVCDTPLDTKIKRGLLNDVVKLLNLSVSKKNKYKREKAKEFEKRALKGKKRMT
jgi:tubulin polyglutamylase TTLL6/13